VQCSVTHGVCQLAEARHVAVDGRLLRAQQLQLRSALVFDALDVHEGLTERGVEEGEGEGKGSWRRGIEGDGMA
jgi:hypothetical protein